VITAVRNSDFGHRDKAAMKQDDYDFAVGIIAEFLQHCNFEEQLVELASIRNISVVSTRDRGKAELCWDAEAAREFRHELTLRQVIVLACLC
jgi:hypothetical protein